MKTVDILKRLAVFCLTLAAIALYTAEPARDVRAGETLYNVVPCMMWTLSKNRSAMHSFTFGEGVHAFRFDPVDIREMEYLEFDVFISDADVVRRWKTGETEFEITSSGTCDVQEYAWSGYDLWRQAEGNGLKPGPGWNHVRLNLPEDSAADLSRINYIRWYWNEPGEGREMPGCRVANLKFTAEDGEDPASAHLEPFIPDTVFETEDVPVAMADVTEEPYNADPSGEQDSSEAIQKALNDVSLNGGGTVWMPAGKYRITKSVRIPAYVTLRGDWVDPDLSDEYGTLLACRTGSGPDDRALVTLKGEGAGLSGIRINYPENHGSAKDRKMTETAYAVRGTASNVYIVNSYITSSAYGVDFSGCDHHCVRNVAVGCYRNPLKLGGRGGVVSNCFGNPYMFYITATPYAEFPQGQDHNLFAFVTKDCCDFVILENAGDELIYNIAMYGAHFMLTNKDSTNVTAINISSDDIKGIQTVMDGGSLTVVNAMRWGGLSFRHYKGSLRICNRFEHGFSSGLHGDAVEETYAAVK